MPGTCEWASDAVEFRSEIRVFQSKTGSPVVGERSSLLFREVKEAQKVLRRANQHPLRGHYKGSGTHNITDVRRMRRVLAC